MQSILLIQNETEGIKTFPLGLSYLGTYLTKHNIDVTIFDMNLYQNPFKKLKKLLDKNFTLIGISLRNLDLYTPVYGPRNYLKYIRKNANLNELERLINFSKAKKPKTKLVIGGAGFTILAKELMDKYKNMDFGIVGQSEIILTELMKNIENPEKVKGIYYRRGNKVFYTGKGENIKNIDFIPEKNIKRFGDLKIYDSKIYDSVGVQTKRGCTFKCAHCVEPYIQEGPLILRDIGSVIKEVREIKNNHGISNIMFTDSVVNYPVKHFKQLCKAIINNNMKIKWRGYFRFEHLNKDLVKLAVKSGCDGFVFSPESGSEKIRKRLGINLENERIISIIKELKKYNGNINVFMSFFLNSPGETIATLIKTLFLAFKLKRINNKIDTDFSIIRIYPNTLIYDQLNAIKNKNILKPFLYNPFPLKLFTVPFLVSYYFLKNGFQTPILDYFKSNKLEL